MPTLFKSLRALTAAAHVVAPFAAVSAAHAKTAGLPPPVISRALDALLMPNSPAVARTLSLPVSTGVLVLAVEPGGVADRQGIEPGDVLVEVAGTPIRRPADIDAFVARGLKAKTTRYAFDVSRAGTIVAVATAITYELFVETFSVTEISTWESWSESSFSYSEYVSEYSEEITESYESTETTVEEVQSSEEATSQETTTEETASEDAATEDASSDESATDDAAADDADDAQADDAAGDQADDAADDQADDAGADDGADDAADDGGADAGDDGADDAGDDGAGDDGAGDDGADDAGGDDGGGDEEG